jgi:hypothetical protein
MGLFDHMKLAGKEVVTEETEPLKDGQLPILEKTAGLVVQPSNETSSLLGKRRAEATVSGALDPNLPSLHRPTKGSRKGMGAPGLKPSAIPNSSASRGSDSSSEESDSTSGTDPSVQSGEYICTFF